MDRSEFAELLRGLRTERGLTQDGLARATGLSTDTIAAYEQGRRAPRNEVSLDQIADAMGLDRLDASDLRRAAGFPARPTGLLDRMARVRPATSVWDEVDGPWPTLIMNERHEIVAWNAMANAVAELDIGTLPPLHRNLLRMASTKRFDQYLRNWDQIIGNLLRIMKSEGVRVEDPAATPAHFLAIINDIMNTPEDAYLLNRVFALWATVEPWPEGSRNVHPIGWRLGDGTELSFVGVFREWSTFDGLFTFDWHPADAITSEWAQRVHASLEPVVSTAHDPAASPGAALLLARRELNLSRAALAARSGVPATTIEAYEAGRRLQPGRDQVLRLARGLSLDTYRTNSILRLAGYDDEPSDFALWMAGDTPQAIFANHQAITGTTIAVITAEADSFGWPCFVLDGRCHVIHANAAAEALAHLSAIETLPGRPAPHLMQLAVNREIRARLLNWPMVAATVLPGRLRPLVLGESGGVKEQTELADVAAHLRATDRGDSRLCSMSGQSRPTRPTRVELPYDSIGGPTMAGNCSSIAC